MTTGERIKAVRKETGLTQGEFGQRLSLVASTICLLENDSSSLTERVQKDICREFNIRKDWLLYGEGEMHVGREQCSMKDYEDIMSQYPSLLETVKIVSKHMTNEDWKRVNELLKEMEGQY